MNGAGHLPPELSFGYEHGLLSPNELSEVHDHIAACEACRRRLAGRLDSDGMADDARSSLGLGHPRTRGWFFAYAAAAALLVAAAGSLWRARRAPSGGDDTPAVREALRAGRLPLPGFLNDLASARETLMGGAPGAAVRRLSPAATVVMGGTPRFRWEALPGRWTYEVRVFRADGEAVAASPRLSGLEWRPEHPLAAGQDYAWQVVASRGEERVTLPEPPASPPRFRVLDSATSARLRELARLHPDSHLLLGVEFARAGAVDDAREEIAAALRESPGRADVRALLGSLPSPDR